MASTGSRLAQPVWRATPRGNSPALRAEYLVHGLRGDHTLCGIRTHGLSWVDAPPSSMPCWECAAIPPGHGTVLDLLDLGITYRRIDNWTVQGWIKAHRPNPGTGHRRTWPAEEVAVAERMHRLVEAGVSPRRAHDAARNGGWLSRHVQVIVVREPAREAA